MIRKAFLFLFVALLLFLPFPFAEGKERLVIDEAGRSVKVPDSPRSIVSLAPNITEILFALGLDHEIAGVTDYCDTPEAALLKPRIGGFSNPSIERIVSLKPDLVIATRDGNQVETVSRLTELGLRVYWIDPRGFDGVMKTIRSMGEAVGRQEASRGIVKRMAAKKESIAGRVHHLSKPRVFFQVGDAPIVTVGKGSLGDDLIRLAGGRSISEDESMIYPVYGVETVVSKAPEVIIISSMDSRKNYPNLIKRWENWKSIPAVRMNAIYVVDSNLSDRPTHRIVEGLEVMAGLMHPKVFAKK
jgi:iron complex transport system substrate-binding protein